MKKNTFKRLAAFLISGSLSIMNIPISNATEKNNVPGQESEENDFQEIRMISVEGETSEYGERPVHFVDENGNEIIQELVPKISAGGTFAFYSLSSLTPSRYDLREQDQLPAVRNQYDTGTCWAHAALAAAETNLIKKGLADTSVDLSEAHLVWFGNCSASTDTDDPLYNEGWNYGTAGYDDIGSYSANAAGVLARGSGIEFEQNTPPVTDRPALPESQRYVSHGYIQNSDFLDSSDQTNIKKHIMNTGALMVSYYSKDSLYYDKVHFSYYDPNNDNTNHAVNIVGWDDDFSRYNFGDYVPDGDGAWICRNSWGSSYGEDGYFYLSYYDASIGGITSFEIGPEGKYDGIYQYDGLAYSAVGYSSAGIAAGNTFKAKQNETVAAAGFYTHEASVPYNISVYTNLNGSSPASGTLAASQDGLAEFAGYHAIDLETPVPVSEGQSFSIVITLKKNGAMFYCDNCGDDVGCTYYTNYNVSTGRTGSSWTDCAVKYEQNLCIKALTSRGTAIDSEHFPDGSFRDYISANIDKDGDGFLSEEEISAVSDIDVDSTGIASLKGIEYFTELVSLNCGNNSLISLDLSENKKLSVLSCEGNLRNLGEPSCGAWATLGVDTVKIIDLNGAEIKNGIIIPDNTTITYSFDCGNNFIASFTILADTSHSYQITPSNDPVYHNVICNVCGDEYSTPHSYGEWKNSDADTFVRICSDCGYEHITTSADHDFGLWTDNGDGTHSRICSDCKVIETSEHTMTPWTDNENGTHSRLCTDCGFTETSEHAMTSWTDNGDGTHSRSCTDCGFTETSGHTMTSWTDNGDGTHSRSCTDCGFTETSGHTMTSWTDNGDDTHSRICSDCKVIETSEHTMTPWTDNENGTHSRSCTDCGFTETSGHTMTSWTDNSDGTHSRSCTDCGFTETSEHAMTSWTDNSDGTHSRSCTDCGFTETSEHAMTSWTDNGDGTHSHICADCGFTETSGHNFGDWTTDIKGFRTRECELCGCTETETIEFIRGDLNGDDIIDAFDMVLLRRVFIKGFDNKSALPAADINNDGQFNIADLVSLQRYILGFKD